MSRKVTKKNLKKVMDKLFVYAMDFFGTEGQCDPRGDRRND